MVMILKILFVVYILDQVHHVRSVRLDGYLATAISEKRILLE